MGLCCGIDFGTTYSAISWYDTQNERVETVELRAADGRRVMRSAVYFPGPDQGPVVGQAAWHARGEFPDRVIHGIKRSIGMADAKIGPIDGVEYTPEDIAAIIFKALVKDAGNFLGEEVTDAVITVPACFDTNQRAATRKAGELAGLNVLALLPEPHAALLTYCVDRAPDLDDMCALVYDLGGGTFDVTLMRGTISGSSEGDDLASVNFETVAKEGNATLGGLDWNRALAEIVAKKVMAEHEVDVRSDPLDEALLLEQCEKAKRILSEVSPVTVIADRAGHSAEVTRTEFEDRTAHLLRETQALLENVLEEGESKHNINPDDITVMLAGGATRMPMVAEMVERVTGRPPLRHLNPDLLVSMGAAYWANLQDRGMAADLAMCLTKPLLINTANQGLRVIAEEGLQLPADIEVPALCLAPDGNSVVRIELYQEDQHLGDMILKDLPADLPKGTPVNVTIHVGKDYKMSARAEIPSVPGAVVQQVDPAPLPPFNFSVFHPEKVGPQEIGKLIAYAHLEAVAKEVVQEASERLHVPSGIKIKADSVAKAVPRQSVIKVTPDVPGLVFDTVEATMSLWEDKQSVEFRFRPHPTAIGNVCRGWVHFWLEGMPLADAQFTVFVADEDVPDIFREDLAEANARPYRAVFPSYSHDDEKVVKQMETYAKAFGDEYLRDVMKLRPGERWDPRVLELIKQADVFQLFWSNNAATSDYVKREWRNALDERAGRPDPYFLRPVYWTPKPSPPPPDELKKLHFARVPL